jgi:hypothetical protein
MMGIIYYVRFRRAQTSRKTEKKEGFIKQARNRTISAASLQTTQKGRIQKKQKRKQENKILLSNKTTSQQ